MADLRLDIRASTRQPRQEIEALRRDILQLRTQLGQTQGASNTAGQAVDRFGDEAREAAMGVTTLGRSIFQTSEQAKRFDGVFRATDGRLREANGRYVKGREALDDMGRSFGRASGGAQVFTRSLGSLGGVLGGLGLVAAGAGVLRVGANSVEASVKVEGFRNSLTALYGDAQIANSVLADLQELSLLPGITFESAVQGAVRLKTVSVEGERSIGVIREFGNAAALAGASTDAVGRSLVGFTQILSRGKVSQEEINQILENVPLIGNSIREAFGSIDAEVIRDQLEAAGQSTQDFADILVNQLSMGARASADSTRNAFSNLENATFRLHAAIGDRLSPAVREATGFLTDLANTTADFVAGTNDATRSATSYADALMMASNAAAVNSAIQERIKFLEQERAGLEAAAAGSANYFEIRGRERDAGRQYREAGEELDVLRTALGNTAAATEHFQGVQNELLETQQGITQEIIRLEAQRAGETARAYGQTTQDIRDQREALAETQEQIGENAVVLRALASASTTAAAATDESTAATKESTAATKEATVEIITYAEAIRQVQANIEAYVEEQALLTDFGTFWEIAAGQADGYSTAIDLTTVSVVNLKNELDALTTIFNENNVVSNENGVVLDEETQALLRFLATLDGLDESLANVESRLDAHNAALVNPAVSEAIDALRDYNDVLLEAGVNFQSVDDISDRLTDSIREQASAFDELRSAVAGVSQAQDGLQGQQIGSDVFDPSTFLNPRFDASPPDFTQGRGFDDPRIIGGDNTFENNLLALGRNLENFTEGFTVNVGDIVSAVEGGISPLDAFERTLTQLDPAFGVLTTTVRLLVEEIGEAERRRDEFLRTRDITETQRGTFGRGRGTGLGSDTEFPGSSGLFQTQIATGLSLVQGTGEEAIISSLLNQFGAAGADRPLAANLDALEMAYQPFLDSLQTAMEAAGNSLEHAIGQGFDESVISRRTDDLAEATTRFYDIQIREVRAAAALSRNDPRNAVFALVRERDAIINQATNQLRGLSDRGIPNNVIIESNIRRGQSLSEATGTDQDFTDSIARAQYGDAAFDTEIATARDAPFLDDLNLSNIQTQADDAIQIFNEAINSPIRTIQSINEAFTTLEPQLQTLYDTLFDGIAGADGIINTAEEEIAFNELGTFEQFTARYAGLRDTAIAGVNASRQRLDTISQQIATDNVIGVFRDSILAPSQTVEGLIEAWDTNVVPSINALYDQLFANIAGPDGFINTTDETTAFLQLGSREDFTADFRTNLLEPGISKLQSIESAIAGITQDRELTTTFDGFNAAILAPAQTIEGLTAYWETNVVPTLRETYDFLRGQIIGEDGLISPDENLQLIQMGLDIPFVDWEARHEDNILDPGIARLQSAAAIIASITQNREVDSVTELFDMALQAPGQTITGITTFWESTVTPVLLETYNFLRAEIIGEDGLISPEELAELTQKGLEIPFEDWESNYRGDILQPGISSLQQSTNTIAGIQNNRQLDGLFMGFNAALEAPSATVAGVTQYWIENIDPVLMEIYEYERGLIIGEDGLISPQELAQLTQADLDLPFTDWSQQYKDQIFTPGITKLGGILTSIGVITQEGTLDNILGMFNTSAIAPGATVEGLGTFWQENVDPVLRDTYDTLRAEIIGADGLISPSELRQLTQAGLNTPFVDWASAFETDIRDPALANLDEAAAHLTSTELSTGVDTLIETFRESAAAPGATISALTEAWNSNVVPALSALYANLFADVTGPDGIINTTLEQADLLRLGTEDDFIAGFSDDIFTPLTTALGQGQRQTTSNLARNQVNTTRSNLRQSGSEQEFEDNRTLLLGLLNEFYDAEETRIRALGLSAGNLTDMLQDLNSARTQERQGVIDLDNRFQTERLDMEQRTQDDIADLRDEALDNEADRQQKLADLAEEHQDRLTDIEEDGIRRREDLNRGSQRTSEDLRREFQEDQEAVAVRFDRGEISREAAERQIGDLSRQFLQDQGALQRRLGRRLEDQGIQETRQREDAGVRFTESQADINAQAQAQAQALQEQLKPLLETQTTLVTQQQETANLESTTAETVAMTGETESVTAAMNSATAQQMSESVVQTMEAIGVFAPAVDVFAAGAETLLTAGDRHSEAADHIIEAISGSGLTEAAAALQTVAENFHVLFTGNTASVQRLPAFSEPQPLFVGGGGSPSGRSPSGVEQPVQVNVTVEVQNSDVVLDNEKVGQIVGDTIVKQGQQGRNSLGNLVVRNTER